jgi:hypothetical protein
MMNWAKILFYCITAAGSVALLFTIGVYAFFIAMLGLGLISYNVGKDRRRKHERYDAMNLAFRISASGASLQSIKECVARIDGKGLREKAQAWCTMLISTGVACHEIAGDPLADSVFELAAFGASTGRDVSSAMEHLGKRIKRQIEAEHEYVARAVGMDRVSIAGLGFFLPAFGGIASGLMRFTGSSANSAMFEASIAGFILCCLCINALFSVKKEKTAPRLAGIAISFSISALVMITVSRLLITFM